MAEKTLTVAIMDAPYESPNSTTALRIINAALSASMFKSSRFKIRISIEPCTRNLEPCSPFASLFQAHPSIVVTSNEARSLGEQAIEPFQAVFLLAWFKADALDGPA
jgi:sulfur relay (sulfurtransferase) complex TusBCD TusD component (DsrE family)